jgi:iron complex transport system ATP-binding protein
VDPALQQEMRRGLTVAIEGLSFAYGREPLFGGLDLAIASGEMAGLIGANGSGKTTLLKLISGVLRPSSGSLSAGGVEVAAIPPAERARRVAVVPQESRLIFDFTVLEAVLMGRSARMGLLGIETGEDLAAARAALESTGMIHLADRSVSRLSGGERQLVLVARALAQEPGLLLLDEPTAFLDIRHRLEIYRILDGLNREQGITVLTTSHDINLAARFCSRLILLKRGCVIADGPTAEVFKAEILSEVYETPLRVLRDPETGAGLALPRE